MRPVHSLALGLGFYHGGIEGLTGRNGDPLSVELKLDKVFHGCLLLSLAATGTKYHFMAKRKEIFSQIFNFFIFPIFYKDSTAQNNSPGMTKKLRKK